MAFRLEPESLSIARPRVTPHPDQAAALQRRMEALAYHPQNGFHRDLRQGRQDRYGRVAWVVGDRLG